MHLDALASQSNAEAQSVMASVAMLELFGTIINQGAGIYRIK
jgi:predicted Rossmann fold nucleotide-binding protein DprA/Smf involved in DNA uptake